MPQNNEDLRVLAPCPNCSSHPLTVDAGSENPEVMFGGRFYACCGYMALGVDRWNAFSHYMRKPIVMEWADELEALGEFLATREPTVQHMRAMLEYVDSVKHVMRELQ